MKNENTLTFAGSVKEEIALKERNSSQKRALLASFLKLNGHIRFVKKQTQLTLDSESASIAKLLYSCINDVYHLPARFSYTRSAGFLKRVVYHVIVDGADVILNDLHLDPLGDGVPEEESFWKEELPDYLTGAFLATGSVNDPMGKSYHLEIRCADENYAKWFAKAWGKAVGHAFTPKVAKRRNHYVVYLKSSEQISNFLILVQAENACFYYEDVRVARDYRNVTNRLMNLDTANMSKSLSAGARQAEEIAFLKERGLLKKIRNPKSQILCELRLKNPEMTLSDIADSLSKELSATVSKSNVNHLFREIHALYENEKNG